MKELNILKKNGKIREEINKKFKYTKKNKKINYEDKYITIPQLAALRRYKRETNTQDETTFLKEILDLDKVADPNAEEKMSFTPLDYASGIGPFKPKYEVSKLLNPEEVKYNSQT